MFLTSAMRHLYRIVYKFIIFYFRKPCEHLDVLRKNSIFTERACGENLFQLRSPSYMWSPGIII